MKGRLGKLSPLSYVHIMIISKNSDQIKTIIDALKGIDGETMEYILEQIGMTDQMLRQLIMNNPESDTKDILEEKIYLSDQRLAGF
jgi:hypothetical protein